MTFLLAKLAEALLMPAALSAILVLGGLLLSWWRPRSGKLAMAAGVLLLWGFGSLGVAGRLLAPLEHAYPLPMETLRAEAAVVLSGTVDLYRSTPDRIEFGDRPERIIEGAKLVKEGRARWLVITGGSGDPLLPEARESEFLARFAEEYGVAPGAILREGESKTTAENAAFTARIVKDRGIRTVFLVTSAFHMPRSMACFRKVGIQPIAYPVDFQATPARRRIFDYFPTSDGLTLSTLALHEYLGFVAYWIGGKV